MDTKPMGMAGLAPTVLVSARTSEAGGNPEAEKYARMWATAEYRRHAPGELLAPLFLQVARPPRGAEVLDIGCGTGRGAWMLAQLGGLRVTMLDFVEGCLDPEVAQACATPTHGLRFVRHDIEQPFPVAARYGYCVDVMEHIPEARVPQVLGHILSACQHVFFSIATLPDRCGALIGERLHLTVRPAAWWAEQLARHQAVIHWSDQDEGAYRCYVSAWASGREVVESGRLNETEQAIRANVAENIRPEHGWRQIHPAGTNDLEVAILGGGPSLNAFEADIRAQQARGVKLVTLNGAYHWARERGLWPVTQIVVDARPFNARFTHPPDPRCLYLIASQCHPSVLAGLPQDRTYLYHTLSALVRDLLDARYGPGGWHPIPGGSTVLLRAIPLLRLLGYRRFHLYGCDSCLGPEDQHHAFAQPENDSPTVVPVLVNRGERVFRCMPWMVAQAQEFLDLIRAIGDVIELAVYGDGLLAYLLQTAADDDPVRLGAPDVGGGEAS
jgi:2-polyprenyl-3-methyl-5-hydroxy-6-metoxy-1,4-benzoquinol methylase